MLKLIKRKKSSADSDAQESKKLREVKTEKQLSDFEIGQEGVVTAIQGDGKIRRRLFDMGVTPGAEIYLRKKAPLGDPIEVTLRGYELTLRKNEACAVTVLTTEQVADDADAEVAADKEAQNG